MLSSNCAFCGSKVSRFIKKQDASGKLNILDINILFINKIPIIG